MIDVQCHEVCTEDDGQNLIRYSIEWMMSALKGAFVSVVNVVLYFSHVC